MNLQTYKRPTGHEPRATPQKKVFAQKCPSPEEKSLSSADKKYTFRDLKVWQKAKDISVIIYRMTKHLPQDEMYGMCTQMRRAAISISSNIAEGFNRFYKKDYRRFLLISLGSCGELESQIEVGIELGYFDRRKCEEIIEKLDHENRMLRSLHSRLGEEVAPAPAN